MNCVSFSTAPLRLHDIDMQETYRIIENYQEGRKMNNISFTTRLLHCTGI